MQGFIPVSGIVLLTAVAALGCSNSNSASGDAGASDAGAADCAKIDSACGQPCEMGNSLGVGQFCTGLSDCTNTPQAKICSSLGNTGGNPSTFYCTFLCLPADASVPEGGSMLPTDCGEGAACRCEKGSLQCGCVPESCLSMQP
jgi:hypothetical protein